MRLVLVLLSTFTVTMAGLAGGITTQDASAPEHLEKVWRGVKQLNQGSNDGANHLIPVKVVSAKSQVVAGAKWTYEVLVAESNCSRGEVAPHDLSKEKCTLKDGGNRSLYKIELWEKPWENFAEYTISKIRSVEASEQI